MPKDAPLAVEVPASDRDKPGWVKVGVIAAVGFIVGIAWPRVMGIRLGPSAPGESAAAAAAAASGSAAQAGRAPDAPPASVITKGPAAATVAAPPAATTAATPAPAATVASTGAAPSITIQKGSVLSCKTTDGETKKGKECGSVPGIDRLVQPRVRKLASCSGAEGMTGKLSLVVSADFNANKLTYDVGKSSTLTNIDAIASCLKSTFQGTTTKDTAHEHQRYTVAYSAIFSRSAGGASDDDKVASKKGDKDKSERSAKEAPDDKEEKSETPHASEKAERPNLASGEAHVAWEVALVRDTPKTGGLVARLPRGSKVKVGSAKDGWFQIKFGEGYAHEGWVYRGAIGR